MPEYTPHCPDTDSWQLLDKLSYIDIAEIVRHYLICAEWCDLNEDMGNPIPKDWAGWSRDAMATAYATCSDFVAECFRKAIDFESLTTLYDENNSGSYSLEERLGHDIWLTSCGHGAGFWDRGLGNVGDTLTEIAKGLGSSFAYIGNDGKGELS